MRSPEVGVSFEAAIESRILEAMAEGKFRNLKGQGKPLNISDTERLAGDDWLGNHIIEEAGALPDWLLLGKDIERQEDLVRDRRDICVHVIARGRETGDWERYTAVLVDALDRFAREAVALRRMQDRFNQMAPGMCTQRVGYWTGYHVRTLVAAAEDAGAPGDAFAPFHEWTRHGTVDDAAP